MRDGNIKHSDLNVFYIDHDKEKGSSIKKMLNKSMAKWFLFNRSKGNI